MLLISCIETICHWILCHNSEEWRRLYYLEIVVLPRKLGKYCNGYLGVPGDSRFFGVGGMRANTINQEALNGLLEFNPVSVCWME
jgi:hypothetical protein